jgi:hypothetical protein
MRLCLRVLIGVLGVSAVAICLSIMLLGAESTAWSAERAYDLVTGWRGPLSASWPPTMDSELRFYAPFWGAYGILLLAVAARFEARGRWTPWLAAVFFAGGVGRAISYVSVGAPHPFFKLLMAIELLTPPVLIALWRAAQRPARRDAHAA